VLYSCHISRYIASISVVLVPKLQTKIAGLIAILMGLSPCAVNAQEIGSPVVGFAAGGTGLTSFYVLGFELGPWQAYLTQELTPDYMLPDSATPLHISWLRYSDVMILPDFAQDLQADPDTYFFMDMDWQTSSQYLGPEFFSTSRFQGSLLERQYFTPGVEQELTETSVLGVAAVVAYQRYSSSGLGMVSAATPNDLLWRTTSYAPYQESGNGTGVRLTLREELVPGFAIEAGYQSRIDMQEFAHVRGVYANAADLDIPARATVSVDFKLTARSAINVAVERVVYSDINAFPSRFLPDRFLSLLGDSTSPEFAWDDLTVYSVGWTWHDGLSQQWYIDFSTRSQPSPSSSLLSQALANELADSAITLGYSRRTGANSQLSLTAAYAPPEYTFGGSVLGVTTDYLDQQFEMEAFWTLAF
jgi:hypothetical protein